MKNLFLLIFIGLITSSVSFSQGTIRGKIVDENGEVVIGALVLLKPNSVVGTTTDFDGNYSLKVSDSVAQILVVSYISYQTIEEPIHPMNGEIIIKNFVLKSSAQEVGEVEITAKAVKAKDYYMEKLKMNSSTTLDFISSETMKRTGDANVVSAVARVSGVSTNGGFITVRGIGDRYVKTTINGSRIPTLDPFTNNIKLDMFPASLVDNIIISKTASPDLPGDWAGAYLSVETKDYPEKLSISVETSLGYNNQSTFKDVLTSQRSSTDWLGYDKNFRDHNHDEFVFANMSPNKYQEFIALGLGDYYKSLGIEAETPWNDTYYKLSLVELGLLAKGKFNDDEAVAEAKNKYETGPYHSQAFSIINADVPISGKSFPNNWNTFYRKAPMNFSQSFSIGNQTKLFGKPLGFIAGFRYGSSVAYDPKASANRAAIDANGAKSVPYKATEEASKETNGWSALANVAYKLNSNHSISLLFMPNFTGANNVRYTIDAADPNEFNVNKSQFYEQRKQLVYQFKSEHYIPKSKLKLELNASYTNGKSSAPDFKRLPYSKSTTAEIYGIGQGMNRSYRYLSDNIFDSRLSAELPLGNKTGLARKLKFGGAYQDNHRESDQHDYSSRYGPYAKVNLENGDIEDFFNLNKFDISSGTINGTPYSTIDIYYIKSGYPADHTIGDSKVKAGFALIDYSIIPSLRFAGGLRIEQAKIFTDAFKYDSLGLSADDPRRQFPGEILTLHPGKLKELSYLPSVNIIYKLKKNELAPVNLRLNFSQTVARPSIRELTDVVVFDYELRALIFGNSDLKMVRINNYDLRLESYFKSGDNVSLSLFYKDFRDHIEIADAPLGYTWINVDKSQVAGIEVEGKKSLTKQLELRANVTLVNSRTTYLQKALLITNGIKTYQPIGEVTRTMYGQAPYVINGILAYTADSLGLSVALSYNVQGPRLVISSFVSTFEVYELPRHLVDFKVTKTLGKHFSASLTVRDILNSPVRRSYNYEEGWVLDYDKYRYGTNYVLGISYKL